MKKVVVQDFFLKKNNTLPRLYYKLKNKWIFHSFKDDFEEISINSSSDNFDGIIIKINVKNKSYVIKTSVIGSINVFYYLNGRNIYLGTNLDYLINH